LIPVYVVIVTALLGSSPAAKEISVACPTAACVWNMLDAAKDSDRIARIRVMRWPYHVQPVTEFTMETPLIDWWRS
jgi:hypothetical protein